MRLRMTVGLEEPNRLVVDGLRDFMEQAVSESAKFPRITVIGLGLIGSSIARAVKALDLAGELVVSDADAAVRQRAVELGLGDRVAATSTDAVKDSDLVIACIPVGAYGALAKEIGTAPESRRDCLRCRLGEKRRAEGHAGVSAAVRPFHPGASGGGHGAFRPRRRLRGIVHQ